jgi:transposase
MEATGSYWKPVAEFFHKKGAVVYVVNPARIKAQRKTEQKRSKTDKIDAGLIMRFLIANFSALKPWQPMRAAVAQLQDLVRLRANKVRRRASMKTMIKSKKFSGLALKEAKGEILTLDASILRLDTEIQRVIANDESLRHHAEIADSVLGVGPVVASVLLCESRDFNEISDARQATAFAGLDVVEESSCTVRKPPRISRQGSGLLRSTFVTAAASAIKTHGAFQEFYMRLRGKGMKRKPALVATARKLLEVTVALVLKGEMFDRKRNCKPTSPKQTKKAA